MGEPDDFPYRAEYAKSSRASCRGCRGNIEKASLRLAVLIQSPSFDGKITHWYHYMCFFNKQHPKSVQDIAHFDSLRWNDQQNIKEKIEKGGSSTILQASKKGGKKAVQADKDFLVEYAKSGRAVCKGCEEKIEKDEIRISKTDYESEKAKRYGPVPRWHHVDCFVNVRSELEFFDDVESLPGFNTLSADGKKMLRSKIKKINGKRKAKDEPDRGTKKQKIEDETLQEKQNKKLFYYRDRLGKNLKKAELASLLQHNDYEGLSGGEDKMLDVLADLMTFGNIDKCTVCQGGNLIYRYGFGYICKGDLSEWTSCTNVVEKPGRTPFLIPNKFKESFDFLKKYKYKKNGDRVITKRESQSDSVTSESSSTTTAKPKPLQDLTFVIVGSKFETDKKAVEKKIKSLGGQVSSKVEATTAAIITAAATMGGKSKHIKTAETLGVECVTEDFLTEVEPDGALLMIKKKNMAPWDCSVEERLALLKKCKSSYKSKGKSGSKYELNLPETVQVTLKNGDYIDPKSGLSDCCHVYKRDRKNYSVVLGCVDLSRGLNSYYRLQLLESDNKRSYHVYRSWGRIGTTVGGQKLERMGFLDDALLEFKRVYEEKTGHKFTAKSQPKLPKMWYPLDIVFGEEKEFKKLEPEKSQSKLPLPIKELICLLFDIDTMKSTMVQFELDLKKMPLGKLSPTQLESAYKVLSETMEWIGKRDAKASDTKFSKTDPVSVKSHLLDCSNRFYTLIPHDFGMKNPPLLDNDELVKNKIEMIDSLREIEFAYSLLKSEDGDKKLDPIDINYQKLKTSIEVVDKSSEEFDMIKSYVKNTHATTHRHYDLEVDEVFKIERKGEVKRFKPFKKLPNRQLLWHGSRLTNFVGIMSQGLRIAPPEAPATGYMFGKGIYFADMVSKSANYCFTSSSNNTGLLILSDVALGDMYECKAANYVTKLPSGKHSTKGLGQTCPDPSQTITMKDGVKVPLGVGKGSGVDSSSLLYNEYIVYDVAQINIKYLLRTTFNYKC